jgi:surfactin synthase thioesterase subunit
MNGPEINGPEINGPEINGPEINGPGTNGPGTNGPGTNGPGTSNTGTNGPGTSSTGDWFVSGAGSPPWSPRIFCFPHAGGSPRAFLDWQEGLGEDAEILAICRPGREHRSAEPHPTITELVSGAAEAIAAVCEADGRPCYLFGHSLGALTAFEVCRRLTGSKSTIPRHFIASGCSAPSLLPSRRVQDIAKLTGQQFAEAVGFFGGLPAEVIADEEMRDLLLPGVIADFNMAVGYRYQAGPKLAVPATVVVGRDDPHVRQPQIEPWDTEFSWPVDRHWVDGGHFYFEPDPAAIVEILRSLVRADQHVELI